jgi:helicase SWR1
MLKKANQKRLLDNVVIQQGDFTTEFFGKMDWRDMLDDSVEGVVDVEVEPEEEQPAIAAPGADDLTRAFAQVEDEEDAAAAQVAQYEGNLDAGDFAVPAGESVPTKKVQLVEQSASATPAPAVDDEEEDEEDLEGEPGSVDEYMLRLVQWDWDWFA